MTPSIRSVLAAAVALAWIGAVAASALSAWPRVPLDVSARDPAVAAAYQRAVQRHVLRAALVAGVPVAIGGIALLVIRRRASKR